MSILIIVCGFQVIKGESVVLFLFKKIWQILLLDSEQKSWSDRMHQRNLTAQCHACVVCFFWELQIIVDSLFVVDDSCVFLEQHWNIETEQNLVVTFLFHLEKEKERKKSTFQSVSSARDTHITEWGTYAGVVCLLEFLLGFF